MNTPRTSLSRILPIGIAIFAMLFGAGNIVFPLGLGRETTSQASYAIIGFLITGIVVPLLGLIAASLFDGSYKKFLGTIGKIPGAFLAAICMLLLGPLGATPRCITVAYAAVTWHFPHLSTFAFSLAAAALVFVATMRRGKIVELLGKFLGPLKLVLLLSIVVIGLLSPVAPSVSSLSSMSSFFRGIIEGLGPLDLLATIFFSGLIVTAIKAQAQKEELSSRQIISIGIKAGIIGGCLLGIVYTGFCLLAAKYGALVFVDVPKEQLLSVLTMCVLGSKASLLVNVTVTVACITTAIALTAVFADYLTHEVFLGRISYWHALLLTVTTTFAMANLGFAGVAHVIEPFAILCYPALIALSLANIAHVLCGFTYIRTVTFITFIATVAITYAPHLW
ncbi:MAG: branched-chain amino acid transport system II carrier protein [Candidatus Babeliales bacterium]|jgi:LIVCS family branched-chain amino acid:cation transporter